jgi:Transposase zinc-binding domain
VSDRFLRGAITVGLRRGAQLYQFRRRSVFVRTERIWTECVTDVLGLLIGHHARLWADYRAPVATTAEAVTRPPFEAADIIRQHGDRFVETHGAWLTGQHQRVLRAFARRRTAALGGHLDRGARCDHRAISYNSCCNRRCPKCLTHARDQWLAERERELLPVGYHHVVFTLRRPLVARAPE